MSCWQTAYREAYRERERESERNRAGGGQTSTVNFISFFLADAPFSPHLSPFLPSPFLPSIHLSPCLSFARISLNYTHRTYDWVISAEISISLSTIHLLLSPSFRIAIKILQEENEEEGRRKRPDSISHSWLRMPSTSLTARQTPDRRLE